MKVTKDIKMKPPYARQGGPRAEVKPTKKTVPGDVKLDPGYEDPKEGLSEMNAEEKKFGKDRVRSERIIDYDERAGYLEQNDLMDLEGDNSPKANRKRKQLKQTIKNLDREAQIMRDRTNK